MKLKIGPIAVVLTLIGAGSYAAQHVGRQLLTPFNLLTSSMGKQPDGSFIVSSGQRIEPGAIAFDFRPIDIALHPSGEFFAVLNQNSVFLADAKGVIADSRAPLADGAGFRGAVWSPDGKRLFASVSEGYIQELALDNRALAPVRKIAVQPPDTKGNPRPGGMAITRDGSRLFVVAADRNAVAEIDLSATRWVREYPVQTLPFGVRLSQDEKTLIVSDWGGRKPEADDVTSKSGNMRIVVDPRGVASTGMVSLIDRGTGATRNVKVGLHPTDIVVQGDRAFVANAAGDSISEIDVPNAKALRTLPLKWGKMNLFGSMPCALAIHDKTLYACNGGDNAVCEIDLAHGAVRGFRPAGYYPTGIQLSQDGKTAYVVNTKGNGSVRNTVLGKPGNVHQFQGTVSVIDLTADLRQATDRVAADNNWDRDRAALNPDLPVYKGAIKHVLYIIKENRTYDEVFGDMPEGNGDPKLCDLGETITPNAHAIARQFTLFDNGYVSGTNSADGHEWCVEAMAGDYIEHFYTGYRTYPDDGTCAMARSTSGALWDTAAKAHKTIRDYGEHCDDEDVQFDPKPKSWMDMWKDRESGGNSIKVKVVTQVPSLKRFVNSNYVYWPLLQSDQRRADIFIEEYAKYSRADRVPNLMLMSLPSDHTEGRDPDYPQPQCMVSDNDLALGRIVEAVSKSPQWKDTCIFVIEDDAQSGPDHVDGHRTVYMALSPYTRRHYVDHEFGTTVSMVRSIEMMLGLPPMNKFDALTPPLTECFTGTPDLTPYTAVPNRVPLGKMNPPVAAQKGQDLYWTKRSLALDWSGPDRADPKILNQILWYSLHHLKK